MSDLISRQAAIDEVVAWLKDRMSDKKNGKPLTDRIKDLSSAQPDLSEYSDKLWKSAYERGKKDALKRKTGEWEEIKVIADAYDINGVKTWASKMKCDQCGFTTIAIEGLFSQYNFCPECGADMRGGRDKAERGKRSRK